MSNSSVSADPEPGPISSGGRRVPLPQLLAGLFFLVFAVVFAVRALPIVDFPFALKYGEGVLLDQSRRAFSEPGLYPDVSEPPYLVGNYPPVYPVLVALFPEVEGAPFAIGRLLSILAIFGSSLVLLWIVQVRAGPAAGLLAGGLFLALPEISDFGVLMRIDAVGLFFALAGYAATVGRSGSSVRWRVIGAALFFLAIYTRHSLVALPICAYVELYRREGVRALRWPAGLFLAGASAFLIGFVVTNGQIYTHMIYLNKLPFETDRIVRNWWVSSFPWRYPLYAAALLALAPARIEVHERSLVARGAFNIAIGANLLVAGAMVIEWQTLGPQEKFAPAVLPYMKWFFGIAGLIVLAAIYGWTGVGEQDRVARGRAILLAAGAGSALFVGRAGSDVNYLFELLAIGCLLASTSPFERGRLSRGIAIVLLGAFAVGSQVQYEGGRTTRLERREEIAKKGSLLERLRGIDGPILSDDPSIPAILERPVEVQPFMYRQLVDIGVWDPVDLKRAVEARRFAAVVLSKDFFYSGLEQGPDGEVRPVFHGGRTWNANQSLTREVLLAIIDNYEEDPSAEIFEWVTDRYGRTTSLLLPKPRER